ncbi:MAG: SPFH domain-containing protein [Anaerolineae bacterium]
MFSRYLPHIKQMLLMLGLPLFVVLLLGLSVEAWLYGPEFIPDVERVDYTLLEDMGALVSIAVRLALPMIGVFVAIPIIVSALFQKVHAIDSLEEAHNSLHRVTFGLVGRRPYVIVGKGQILLGKKTFAGRVGGPCTMIVYDDNAVVTQQYGRIKRILGAGVHSIERFEKVWEIIDLQPQHWVYPVFAMTKEGIPIRCDADISFRIDDKPGAMKWPVHTDGLYSYSEEAVFKAATSVWMREPDHPEHKRTWAGRVVISSTEGLLRNILAEYWLDWLLAPPQPGQKHPREEIREQLEQGLNTSIGKVGAKLIRADIGPIEVQAREDETTERLQNIIPKQRVDAWYADWEARALGSRAEMEAALMRMDTARVRAQAEVIAEIVGNLQETISTQGIAEPYVLAVRLVESLRWMSYNTYQHEFAPPETVQRLKRLRETLKGFPDEFEQEEEEEKEKGREKPKA